MISMTYIQYLMLISCDSHGNHAMIERITVTYIEYSDYRFSEGDPYLKCYHYFKYKW